MGNADTLRMAHAAATPAAAAPAGDAFALGAHLVTPRLGYTHHGIYVGNGRVVHYAGLSRSWLRGPVEEVSLEQFAGGREVIVRKHRHPRYRAADIVARARSRLGEDAYRLTSNNCEHFCAWCVSGVGTSEQVEAIARWFSQLRDSAVSWWSDALGASRVARAVAAGR